MTEHGAEFVSRIGGGERDGAQQHWASIFHTHVADRIAKSERETQAAIEKAVAPLRNELARLRAERANAEPDAALLGFIRAAVAAALDADAVACAAANKKFVSLLIVEAIGPLRKQLSECETVIRRLVRSDAERQK